MTVKARPRTKSLVRSRRSDAVELEGHITAHARLFTTSRTSEPTAWSAFASYAETVLGFWIEFLRLRKGTSDSDLLDASDKSALLRIVRAVSWVESVHGTGTGHQASRDPMQCGNRQDEWWQILRGDKPKKNRYVSGPGGKNYWAEELPRATASDPKFPASAKVTFPAFDSGHDSSSFTSDTSFAWAIPHLLWNVNQFPSGAVYKCGDLSRDRIVEGAVKYNGGGDPMYRDKIDAALTLVGWPPESKAPLDAYVFGVSPDKRERGPAFSNERGLEKEIDQLAVHVSSALSSALTSVADAAARSPHLFPGGVHRIHAQLDLPGSVTFTLTAEGPAQVPGISSSTSSA